MKRYLTGLAVVSGVALWLFVAQNSSFALPQAAPPFSVQYMEGTQQQKDKATSSAVVTQGGRLIWLAGQSGGGSPGNFEGNARSVFTNIQMTIARSGASLKDLVFLKVFIKSDPANCEILVKIIHELFPDGKFPATTMVTVSYAGSLIEIQGVAVVPN